jgi:predicted ATP-grasp superfamily ATP-dependent carboligase
VERLATRWSVQVLLPMTDASLTALLPAVRRFEGIAIPFPDITVVRRVNNKALVLETASGLGIPVPAQRLVMHAGEQLRRDGPAPLSFPLVVKPTVSVVGSGAARVKLGVSYARDADELAATLQRLPAEAYPVLLQRRIVGPGLGIFLLRWDGQIRAVFAHRRIREKPPSGGVSVYSESIPADPTLVEQAVALLEQLTWQGVAMVEYKQDQTTGVDYLMEVNGRFWGSLQLAVDAGVDFPALLVAAALGQASPVSVPYRTGIRTRWEWGDVDHLWTLLRRPNGVASPSSASSRWHAVREFLTFWRAGDRNEVLRLNDPLPFVRETMDWVTRR